ncbi:VWA domain-containing protein [Deinococcus cavernae]|uniref:VWA domain-containing protein n=1 Tax=Deinococcus cavernae TaxID=2320857 RepID=A0A418V8A4_9DEIO|nr:VWA domain-containing protein [Deinococcus cavernae]RJF72322.1 VWA domain-containing protein [Deinococcus cavernae]
MRRPDVAGDLAAHLPDFAARLRLSHGFLLGPGEVADALRALVAVNILNMHEVRDAWRAIFSTSPEQGRLFDAEFEAFFRFRLLDYPPLPPLLPQMPGGPPQEATAPAGEAQEGQKTTSPRNRGGEQLEAEALPGTAEGQAHDDPDAPETDLTLLTRLSPHAGQGGAVTGMQADLPPLLRAARQLVQAVQLGHSRRLVPRPTGRKLDARRTVRRAARTAGDPVTLHWLGRPRRAPRFLIVLDGSRSMGQDAQRLLHFAYALQLTARRVEVYAFSTDLVRLTPRLRALKPGQELTLPELGAAWGGGTRIGENLLKLARQERARVGRETAVFILSDGLDTGEPELVRRALRDLSRRAGLTVWLSPLAGVPNYQPIQRAVAAALPSLDALLPAASTADLLALPRRLKNS